MFWARDRRWSGYLERWEFSHISRILFYKEFNIEAVCVLLGILRSILKFWVRLLLVLSQLTRVLIRNGYVIKDFSVDSV